MFVEYDDNNIDHVLSGPDYGQLDGVNAWSEIDSDEYADYVSLIEEKMKRFVLLKIPTTIFPTRYT